MSADFEAGKACRITRDITIGGELAFEAGEVVTVDKVDPNPRKPDFKYVVASRILGNKYQLTDRDIEPADKPDQGADEGPGAAEREPGPVDDAGGRAPGWFARHLKVVAACSALALAAVAAVLLLFVLPGGQSPGEAVSEKSVELKKVVTNAGASSTSLSVEIQNATRKAPDAEAFAPLGKEIAGRYIPAFQGYYKEIKEIREELQEVEAAPEVKATRASLLKASDSYERAMLEYVTALDQIARGQINEAFATFQDIQQLVNQGNAFLKAST